MCVCVWVHVGGWVHVHMCRRACACACMHACGGVGVCVCLVVTVYSRISKKQETLEDDFISSHLNLKSTNRFVAFHIYIQYLPALYMISTISQQYDVLGRRIQSTQRFHHGHRQRGQSKRLSAPLPQRARQHQHL